MLYSKLISSRKISTLIQPMYTLLTMDMSWTKKEFLNKVFIKPKVVIKIQTLHDKIIFL